MNSDVVAVFNSDNPDDQDVAKSLQAKSLDFYTHTTAAQGVKQGLWEKVGNFPVVVDVSELTFKNYYGKEHAEILAEADDPSALPPIPYPNWTTWTPLDKEWHYVDEKTGADIKAEDGSIVPASDVIYRIEHGVSEFKSNWPEKI